MAGGATARARGRSLIRPWRVGLLVDTTSTSEVRSAIARLSSVWGGRYMPILDRGASLSELKTQGTLFDVDSLYADDADGPLADMLREPGWAWMGFGDRGPFAERTRLHKGLLPIAALVDSASDFVQPRWDPDDVCDLAFSAMWGLSDAIDLELSPILDSRGPRSAPLPNVLAEAPTLGRAIGAAELTGLHLRTKPKHYLDEFRGFAILRPDDTDDVVRFWNMRTYGTALFGLPSDGAEDVIRAIVSMGMSAVAGPVEDEQLSTSRNLWVWGLGHASARVRGVLQEAASKADLTLDGPPSRDGWPYWAFQGLESPFKKSIRVEFRPGDRWVDVPLATLPLADDPYAYSRGVVAADIDLHRVDGQDPRFSASLPPYRRHSELLKGTMAWANVDHARVSVDGQVIGIEADREHAPYAFAYNLEVFQKLFVDDSVKVAQSEIGRFQTRAAEKFGGPFSGIFNQPGIRSAVLLTAKEREGVPLPHLRQVVERDRGDWPGPFPRVEPRVYAERELNLMLHSGLFVPTLRVHCSHCRVERWASADELGSTMACEFCGETFQLALSHALAQPAWRYRLAAHLRPSQVQALLPALATASLIRQFRHVEEPPLAHVLGLEIEFQDRSAELDVAIYVPDHDFLAVIGEVKSANRIDEKDVSNVDYVATQLAAKDVRCLPLFATMKPRFGDEEVALLRSRVEQSTLTTTARRSTLPNMPLVLTGPDLSHSPDSEEHPWRWDSKHYSGLQGTAITSCERNLGLSDYTVRDDGTIDCEWGDDPQVGLDR